MAKNIKQPDAEKRGTVVDTTAGPTLVRELPAILEISLAYLDKALTSISLSDEERAKLLDVYRIAAKKAEHDPHLESILAQLPQNLTQSHIQQLCTYIQAHLLQPQVAWVQTLQEAYNEDVESAEIRRVELEEKEQLFNARLDAFLKEAKGKNTTELEDEELRSLEDNVRQLDSERKLLSQVKLREDKNWEVLNEETEALKSEQEVVIFWRQAVTYQRTVNRLEKEHESIQKAISAIESLKDWGRHRKALIERAQKLSSDAEIWRQRKEELVRKQEAFDAYEVTEEDSYEALEAERQEISDALLEARTNLAWVLYDQSQTGKAYLEVAKKALQLVGEIKASQVALDARQPMISKAEQPARKDLADSTPTSESIENQPSSVHLTLNTMDSFLNMVGEDSSATENENEVDYDKPIALEKIAKNLNDFSSTRYNVRYNEPSPSEPTGQSSSSAGFQRSQRPPTAERISYDENAGTSSNTSSNIPTNAESPRAKVREQEKNNAWPDFDTEETPEPQKSYREESGSAARGETPVAKGSKRIFNVRGKNGQQLQDYQLRAVERLEEEYAKIPDEDAKNRYLAKVPERLKELTEIEKNAGHQASNEPSSVFRKILEVEWKKVAGDLPLKRPLMLELHEDYLVKKGTTSLSLKAYLNEDEVRERLVRAKEELQDKIKQGKPAGGMGG